MPILVETGYNSGGFCAVASSNVTLLETKRKNTATAVCGLPQVFAQGIDSQNAVGIIDLSLPDVDVFEPKMSLYELCDIEKGTSIL